MDFNIYDIPGGVFRRAKRSLVKESPFKEWSRALRATPGFWITPVQLSLHLSAALTRALPVSGTSQRFINANLTESDHSAPSDETLAAARANPEVSWTNEIVTDSAFETGGQNEGAQVDGTLPVLEKVGNGLFSIEGLATSNAVNVQQYRGGVR
jgi:exodeoxyribonuclease VIII